MGGQFLSLLLGDVVLSLAMGLAKRPGAGEIRQRARDATAAFLLLHQVGDARAVSGRAKRRG
jgi:hypothetical protein